MNCKVCSGDVRLVFVTKVLNKYDVKYFTCNVCGYSCTENPYWLNEAYANAITSTDIGLIYRNIKLGDITENILLSHFKASGQYIDYAGGYGIFVRIMRDKGFDFYRTDPYCENLFAKGFDIQESDIKRNFNLATAFEVFEHFPDPYIGVEDILKYSETILFSTELQPNHDLSNWWYISPHTGQHISFYTVKSLVIMAKKIGAHFYTNNKSLHIFSKSKLLADPFSSSNLFQKLRLRRRKNALKSLLQQDFDSIISMNKA